MNVSWHANQKNSQERIHQMASKKPEVFIFLPVTGKRLTRIRKNSSNPILFQMFELTLVYTMP